MAGTKIGNQMKRGVSISKQKNKKEGSVLDRLGFLMLSILAGNSAVDKTSAMTVKEILEIENVGCKYSTLYKKAVAFETSGYLAFGYNDGKARTFYITEKGREFIKN